MPKSRPLSKIAFSILIAVALLAIGLSSQPMSTSQAAAGCQVVYTPNQWNNGFTADVKIVNNNTTAISGWTLTWSFANGQQITGSWNATVNQSGANVTASVAAAAWNGTIAANGGSVSFGFQATHTGVNVTPTNFALNGVACNGDIATNTPTPVTPTVTVGVHPDLTVSGVTFQSGVVGNTCTIPANQGILVAIRNIGNADAGAFVVTLNGARPTTVSGLAAGAETTVFLGSYIGGQTTVVVDATNVINEISEANNQLTTNIPVPTGYPPNCTPTPTTPPPDNRPDLIVYSIVYNGGTPSGCAIPPDLGTRVYVRNIGSANAGAFVVALNNSRSANVAGLAAGAETSVLFAGYNVMQNTAVVDSTNLVAEISESNNQLSVSLPIPTQPPTCTPTPTTPPPSDGCQVVYVPSQWSNGFTADVKIINKGIATINGWTLTWSFANGQQITSAWNATVTQAGANVTASALASNWNGTIGAYGGSVSFGFQAIRTSTNNAPTNFALNGVACNGGPAATNTPTPTASTLTPTPTSSSPTPTTGPGTVYTGNATYFDALGRPYGGCGITQSALDSQNFVALNVQNTPGDYSTMLSRPIASQYADKIGLFNNGLNCGRWVRVTISDYCSGVNDGAPGMGFCHDGVGWVADQYNGATLDMIVADSCQDGNGWCRDDPYHLDLAKASLNLFVKNGQPVGNMYPNAWNNRKITWQFIEAPNYTGDITIGFIKDAQIWWTPIAITHLRNGIHGVDYYEAGAWVKGAMDADMGQAYLIRPTTAGGTTYRIRVYDASDQLINNGRIYNFSFPASCGTQCSSEFTPVTYTIE